jgi:hypothetical protein
VKRAPSSKPAPGYPRAPRDAAGRWLTEGRRALGGILRNGAAPASPRATLAEPSAPPPEPARGCVVVAQRLGICHQAVSQLAAGIIRPGPDLARHIEDILGIPARAWGEPPSQFASATCGRSTDGDAKVDSKAGDDAACAKGECKMPDPFHPDTLPKQEPLPKVPDAPPGGGKVQRNRVTGDPPPRAPGLPPSYGDIEYRDDD